MHKFTFFDTESAWDQDLHAGYKTIEPDLYRYRIGSKRIFAASAFDLTLDAQGQITCERISSWTEHQYGDEEAVVAHLFDHLRARPDYTAVGFGSIATDVSILTLAAMEYGIQRPRQFLKQRPATTLESLRAHPGGHLDLGLALKGGGKTWHHLSEVILRLGLPASLLQHKRSVPFPQSAGEWADVRTHVELDAVLLAIAMMAWCRSEGQTGLNPMMAALAILEWTRREARMTEAMQALLAEVCHDLTRLVTVRMLFAA